MSPPYSVPKERYAHHAMRFPQSVFGEHSDDQVALHKEYSNKDQSLSHDQTHKSTFSALPYQSSRPDRLPKYRQSIDSSSFPLLYHTGNNVPIRCVRNGTGFLFHHLEKKRCASDNQDMVYLPHVSPHVLFQFQRLPRKYPIDSTDDYNAGSTNVFHLLTYIAHQYTDPANG